MFHRGSLVVAVLCCGLIATSAGSIAQTKSIKDQIVGTWALVSATVVDPTGAKGPLVQGEMKGLQIFTEAGNVSMQVIGDHPKVASNDRMKMTPEEMKATAESVLALFGTYTVNEAEKSYSMNVERSTFSNQVGSAKRMVAFDGDQMTVTNPSRIGGGQVILIWRKIK